MRPFSMGDGPVTCLASSAPARVRMSGRTDVLPGAKWRTTKIAASMPLSSFATSRFSVSTPPAEAPTTITSRRRLSGARVIPAPPCLQLGRAELRLERSHAETPRMLPEQGGLVPGAASLAQKLAQPDGESLLPKFVRVLHR